MDADNFCESLTGDMVDIYVGSAGTHFHLPLKLLSRHSYFDKAFNGDFKEGITKRLNFPDEDIHAFNLLVQWLYTGRVDCAKRTTGAAKSTKAIIEDDERGAFLVSARSARSSDSSPWKYSSLPDVRLAPDQDVLEEDGAKEELYPIDTRSHLKLYVLADKLDMRVLKNQTIDEIMRAGYDTKPSTGDWYERNRSPPSFIRFAPETINWIYRNTLARSPLRKLASTSAAYTTLVMKVQIKHYDGSLHKEFLVDLVNAMQENANSALCLRTTSLGSRCTYHEHQGETCHTNTAASLSSDSWERLSPAARSVWTELRRNSAYPESLSPLELARRLEYDVAAIRNAGVELLEAGLSVSMADDEIWAASGWATAPPPLQ